MKNLRCIFCREFNSEYQLWVSLRWRHYNVSYKHYVWPHCRWKHPAIRNRYSLDSYKVQTIQPVLQVIVWHQRRHSTPVAPTIRPTYNTCFLRDFGRCFLFWFVFWSLNAVTQSTSTYTHTLSARSSACTGGTCPESAFWPFKVIQGGWFWYQSKARMLLPISPSLWLWSYLAPFLLYGDLLAKNCLFFPPLSHSALSLPVFPLEFLGEVNREETRVMKTAWL